jgi:hypothetical protein
VKEVGKGFTVTVLARELAEHAPLLAVTEYDPLLFTVIDCVVAPLLHTFPLAAEDVSTTELPSQKVVAPEAEMVGVLIVPMLTEVAADVTGPQFGEGEV